MPQILFFISSTTIVLSCLFCATMLWIFSKNSKPKTIMAISYSIGTLFNIYFAIKTYHTNFEIEIFDFSYSIFCIFLVYIAFIYFRVLMRPSANNRYIILQFFITIGIYFGLYFTFTLLHPQTIHLYSFESLLENINSPMLWLRLCAFIHFIAAFIVLCISTLKEYKIHKEKIGIFFSYKENISLSWIPYMLLLFIGTGIGTLFDSIMPLDDIGLGISNFLYAAFNLTIGFFVVIQKDIYTPKDLTIEKQEINGILKSNCISPATRLQLASNLNTLMEKGKAHLNPDLRLDAVVKSLGTNRTYLSLVIKEDMGSDSFIEFVNRYRIKEAKELILNSHLNFSEISEKVGFKSISSFNIFFKRFTGQTPTDFRKENSDKNKI